MVALRGDPVPAERVRRAASGELDASLPGTPSPDLEVRTLARARRRLGWQRGLFGLAWFFTAIALGVRLSVRDGRVEELGLALADHPLALGAALALAAACWLGCFTLRRR